MNANAIDSEAGNRWICQICKEPANPAGDNETWLACAHLFHSACIERWRLVSNTCPECRNAEGADPRRGVITISEEELEALTADPFVYIAKSLYNAAMSIFRSAFG